MLYLPWSRGAEKKQAANLLWQFSSVGSYEVQTADTLSPQPPKRYISIVHRSIVIDASIMCYTQQWEYACPCGFIEDDTELTSCREKHDRQRLKEKIERRVRRERRGATKEERKLLRDWKTECEGQVAAGRKKLLPRPWWCEVCKRMDRDELRFPGQIG
jgi:hypothetical protein